MKVYARVEGGIVVELIESLVGGFDVSQRFHPDIVAALLEAPTGVEPGWLWDGAVFEPPPVPEPVPTVWPALSPRQFFSWLVINRGVTEADVLAIIDAISDPVQREVARLYATREPLFQRVHPLISQIGAALTPPMSPEQIDAAWPEAAAL